MRLRAGAARLRPRARRAAGLAALAGFALCFGLSLAARALAPGLLVNRAGMSQLVRARDGSLLRLSLSGDGYYRLWTPLAEFPPELVEATLLQEDRHFFWHPGVNPVALARALRRELAGGGPRLGGSTLSMQLARLRLGLATRTARGKLAQIAHALALEWRYSKREILEAYLNLAPYGANVEGAGAASWVWFGKPASALRPAESLALTVIPKHPSARSPDTAAGRLELAHARARLAARWNARGGAQLGGEELAALALRSRAQLPWRAPHLADRLLAQFPDAERLDTALDPGLQLRVERAIAAWRARGRRFGLRNAAALLVDTRSLEVLAYAGSADAADASIQGAVDGVRARRSPGSALKPFVYGLALDAGLIHPESMLEDAALAFTAWNPENFERDFSGPVHAVDALVRSRNLPALQLARQLPPPGLHGLLARAGVGGLRAPEHYGLALALGGAELRLDELVRLYAALAAGGAQRELAFLRGAPRGPATPLLSPEASALVLEMLRSNPRPGRVFARASNPPPDAVAWKTGTSFGLRDGWALGVFGRFALGVWVGNFDGSPNPAFVGREAAGPLFFAIADALRGAGELGAPPPALRPLALASASVCALSGMAPGRFCPGRVQTRVIPGRSPIALCTLHRELALDAASGLRACPGQTHGVRREVYEFWPSHLLALFERSGIARRVPPPFDPSCGARPDAGLALRIDSPPPAAVYALRDGEPEEIPLSAVADADGGRISWFIDTRYVGQSEPGGVLFWRAQPGRFTLRATDALGRTRAQPLEVTLLPGRPASPRAAADSSAARADPR